MKNIRLSKRIRAYLTMPLFFSFFGLLILYLAFKPVVDLGLSVSSRIISSSSIDFLDDVSSIYEDKDFIERNRVPLSEVVMPYVGQHYAKLEIEHLNWSRNVFWGDNDRILLRGVGQYAGSFMPGFNKPIMLSGHNLSMFYEIQFLEVGDLVTIKTNYGKYQYLVFDYGVKTYPYTDAFDLGKDEEELILYTCYPFTTLSTRNYDRYFVYARRISGPDVR